MEIASHLHHFGNLLGFGGAMVSAALMLRPGPDDDARRRRGRLVRWICLVTWTGLALLLGSGVALNMGDHGANALLLGIKHLLVLVIVVDATLIHLRLFPRYFDAIGSERFTKVYGVMRGVGALSVCCWVAVIALSVLMRL